jgi:hypothetical protein
MEVGSKVKFIGCDEVQRRFGGPYTGDPGKLIIGTIYTIKSIEEHSWHTHILLENVDGDFNSVCFEE